MIFTRLLAAILAIAALLLIALAGCNRQGASRPPLAPPELIGKFTGGEACRECHAKQFASHRASRHASTLTLVDRKSLGVLTPPPGPVAGTKYVFRENGERLELGIAGKPESFRRIDLAFGSGRSGYSFVCVSEMAIERLRLSYYPVLNTWFVHPGDEHAGLYDPPSKFEGARARSCISCHSTTLSTASLIPESRFAGVGCEKCHGPGAAHIAVAKMPGRRNAYMERLSAWSPSRITELCGQCHGKPNAENEQLLALSDTRRFQANAIMQSRCYWQSGDKLSCITCHDPHTNANPDPRHYDEVCLKCHAAAGAKLAQGNACPVNSKEKCTGCHMKAGQLFANTPIPTKMADHYIRPPSELKSASLTDRILAPASRRSRL